MCFMLPSVPISQNVPQITIVLSRLNRAFHDKTAGRQSAPKKGLITNLYSPLLGAQMSYRMRRNTKNNHFRSCKNPPYLLQLSLLAVLHVLPLSKYLQARKMRKIAPNYKLQYMGRLNPALKMSHVLLDFLFLHEPLNPSWNNYLRSCNRLDHQIAT